MTAKIVIALGVLGLGGLGFLWWLGGSTAASPAAMETEMPGPSSDDASPEETTTESRLAALAQAAWEEKGGELLDIAPTNLVNTQTRYYTSKDVRLTPQADRPTLTTYANNLQIIIARYAQTPRGRELAQLLDFVDSNQTARERVAALKRSHEEHRALLQSLEVMAVPAVASAPHVALINSVAGLTEVIYNMSIVETEPLLAFSSAQVYPVKLLQVLQELQTLNQFLSGRGVRMPTPGPRVMIDFND